VHFPDLSPYSYCSADALPNVLNVGWLESAHPYDVGDIPPMQRDRLRSFAAGVRVNLCRGWHACDFCRATGATPTGKPLEDIQLGNGELWLPGEGAIVFAAPALIYHYVVHHSYRPPRPFLDALDRFGTRTSWDAEGECRRRMGPTDAVE